MGKELSAMEEAFAQNVAGGKMTDAEAFIRAGYSTKGKSKGYIYRKAYEVKIRPRVKARIAELKAEVDKRVIEKLTWTKEKAAAQLFWLLVKARESVEATGASPSAINSMCGVIDRLNALEGVDAKTAATLAKLNADPEDRAALEKLDEVLAQINSAF